MTATIRDKIEKSFSGNPGSIAISYRSGGTWRRISFQELQKNIDSVKAYFSKQGIRKGDRIAICLENRPEWPIVFFASVSMGIIVVPIRFDAESKEIEALLRNSESRVLFTGLDLPDIKAPVVNVYSDDFKNILNTDNNPQENAALSDDDIACILYTSGTTDEPKGVMLSHGNLVSNCEALSALKVSKKEDKIVSILPLHHTYPLTITMLMPVFLGAMIIYPNTLKPDDLTQAMVEIDPTVFVGVPRLYGLFHQKIMRKINKISFPLNILLSVMINTSNFIRNILKINTTRLLLWPIHKKFGRKLRMFVSGGAKLDENVARDLIRIGFTMQEGYGLTETSPVLTMNPIGKIKIGSAGCVIPGVEVKIKNINDDGIGEVIARGPNIMKGYYKRSDLTEKVLHDGWFYTGDLGHIDNEGYLFLTGRSKDVIVLSSGLNVFPEEVEDVYEKEMFVKELCIVEALSPETGLVYGLWALVMPDLAVFRKFGEVNLKAVLKERFDNISRKMPAHNRINGFTITLEPLPRTMLGKLKRNEIRERYKNISLENKGVNEREMTTDEMKLAESHTGRVITGYLENNSNKKKIYPYHLLEMDLGIDSLGRIEIGSGLSRVLKTEVSDELVGSSFTVGDLIKKIEEHLKNNKDSKVEKSIKEVGNGPEYWEEVFDKEPDEAAKKNIDLDPGKWSWIVGFLFIGVFFCYFKLFHRLKVEGKENIPSEGPYLLYGNHTSYYDGLVTACSLPKFPRLELFFLGFRPYLTAPVVRNLVRVGRLIPIDFSSYFLDALRSCYYVLKHKKGICFFPEGYRTLDGKIAEFKKGFGILAKESDALLIPYYMDGTYLSWPRTSKYPKPHKIRVIIGKPERASEKEKQGFEMGAKNSYEAICLASRKTLMEMGKNK